MRHAADHTAVQSDNRNDSHSSIISNLGSLVEQVRATCLDAYAHQDQAGSARITPLLAGIRELLPWVRQWQPQGTTESSERPADVFQTYLDETRAAYGLRAEDLVAWRPARGKPSRKR